MKSLSLFFLISLSVVFTSGCATQKSLLLPLPEYQAEKSSNITVSDARLDKAVFKRDHGDVIVSGSVTDFIKSRLSEKIKNNPVDAELLIWKAVTEGSEIQADAVVALKSGNFSGKYVGKASIVSPLLDEDDEINVLVEALDQALTQAASDPRLVQ